MTQWTIQPTTSTTPIQVEGDYYSIGTEFVTFWRNGAGAFVRAKKVYAIRHKYVFSIARKA